MAKRDEPLLYVTQILGQHQDRLKTELYNLRKHWTPDTSPYLEETLKGQLSQVETALKLFGKIEVFSCSMIQNHHMPDEYVDREIRYKIAEHLPIEIHRREAPPPHSPRDGFVEVTGKIYVVQVTQEIKPNAA